MRRRVKEEGQGGSNGPGRDATEIVCVIDRSGSMEGIRDDVIGGFNAFLRRQQEIAGAARLTLVLFDHEYGVLHDGVPIAAVPPLTPWTYVPRGMTALYDAIGRAATGTAARLATMPASDRPRKVIVAILTDGYENASREFTGEVVKDMITRYTNDLGWDFLYLAANQDAFLESEKIGIRRDFAGDFSPDGDGVCETFHNISSAVELERLEGDIAGWKGKRKNGRRSKKAGDPGE